MPRRKKCNRPRALLRLLFLCVAVSLLCAGFLLYKGMREDVFPADIAVILGNEVYADGTVSPRLAARLDRGLALYRAGTCTRLIVSGGTGKSGYDEATAMAAYLVTRGVPEEALVLDHNGVNSWATARFTAEYMAENGLTTVIAVSQYFHVPRTRLALHMADTHSALERIGGAYPAYAEPRDAFSLAREVVAVIGYLARHGNWSALHYLLTS